MKKLVIRSSLVLVLVILGVFLFIMGKEHIVFVDNLDMTIEGTNYTAASSYQVWIDGQQLGRSALRPGRRNAAYVAGPYHKIELQEIKDGKAVGSKIIKEFKIATGAREVIINIPALVEGLEQFIYTKTE